MERALKRSDAPATTHLEDILSYLVPRLWLQQQVKDEVYWGHHLSQL